MRGREGEAAGEGEEEVGGTGCGCCCFGAVLSISSVVGPSFIVPLVMAWVGGVARGNTGPLGSNVGIGDRWYSFVCPYLL